MTTLIEDSPRAFQAKWIVDAVMAGHAQGAVLTPWATPWHHRGGPGKKPGIRERAQELAGDAVPIWFDATTHALQMGGVGDFRYYDEFDLWGGPRGDLSTAANRDEHVRKVFDVQDSLAARHLGPTVLLHTGLSHVNGQVEVPGFGQVKVPTLCGLFRGSGAVLLDVGGLGACGRTGRW